MPNFNTGAIPVILVDQNGAEKTAFPPGASVTVTGTVTANEGIATNPTTSNLNSAATTNATAVKTSSGNLYAISISNAAASPRFVKLYNKNAAPTVGTDVPVLVIPVAASASVVYEFGRLGQRFAAGIGLAITGAMADTDTTAIGASEVKVCTTYV